MATYNYPRNSVLKRIEQEKLPLLTANRVAFGILPMRNVNAALLRWIQKDNFKGLMNARGLGGPPGAVSHIAENEWLVEPGYFGEYKTIGEREMTLRRNAASFSGAPIDVSDLVMECTDHLYERRVSRIEQIIWNVLKGTFSVPGPNGLVIQSDTFTVKTATAAVSWATHATATPIADLMAIALLGAGTSNQFNASAKMYMNRVLANHLMSNTNAADLGGKLILNGSTVNTLQQVNMIFAGYDLPQVEIMDEGYLADATGTFTRYLGNEEAVVIGSRTSGAPIGYFGMTLNANNPGGAPGPYTFIKDRTGEMVPPTIEVHDGFNGGPVLEFPGSICYFDSVP